VELLAVALASPVPFCANEDALVALAEALALTLANPVALASPVPFYARVELLAVALAKLVPFCANEDALVALALALARMVSF